MATTKRSKTVQLLTASKESTQFGVNYAEKQNMFDTNLFGDEDAEPFPYALTTDLMNMMEFYHEDVMNYLPPPDPNGHLLDLEELLPYLTSLRAQRLNTMVDGWERIKEEKRKFDAQQADEEYQRQQKEAAAKAKFDAMIQDQADKMHIKHQGRDRQMLVDLLLQANGVIGEATKLLEAHDMRTAIDGVPLHFIETLTERFPTCPREDVIAALAETSCHVGKASKIIKDGGVHLEVKPDAFHKYRMYENVSQRNEVVDEESTVVVDTRPRLPKTYTVDVFTGSGMHSGTDASVYMRMIGDRGDSAMFWLSHSNQDKPFVRGQRDRFAVTVPDVGVLQKIVVGHSSKKLFKGWYLDKIDVIEDDDEDDRYEYVTNFEAHRWLDRGKEDGRTQITIYAANVEPDDRTYHIHLVTIKSQYHWHADIRTLSQTWYFRIHGDNGSTEELYLRDSKLVQYSDTGRTDSFEFELVDVGTPLRISVGVPPEEVENLGKLLLDRIEVVDFHDAPEGGMSDELVERRSVFDCGQWDGSEEEGAGVREKLILSSSIDEDMLDDAPYLIHVLTGGLYFYNYNFVISIVIYKYL